MFRITHIQELSVEDAAMVNQLTAKLPATEIVHRPESYPHMWMPTGRGQFFQLAWLVLTFAGAGGAILLHSFFKEIGTELGKRFVDYWLKRRDDKGFPHRTTAIFPCIVIYEVRPGFEVVTPLESSTEPGRGEMRMIPALADKACSASTGSAQLIARFDTGSGQWTLKPTQFDHIPRRRPD